MRTVFEQVEEFNREVLSISKRPLGAAKESEIELSMIQLHEEIGEFHDAWLVDDIGEMADAMVDLIYFACGIAYKQGIGHEAMSQLFNTVHEANMKKAAGKKKGRGYDGDAVDAAKPVGWTAPDANAIVKRHDYIREPLECIQSVGDFTEGDILNTVRYYSDGTYIILAEDMLSYEKSDDYLVWEPDDSIEQFSIADSEDFKLYVK